MFAVEAALCSNFSAVVIHQSNNARIQNLRATLGALNQSITANLTLLADIRKEIIATPATIFPESQRDVPYNELLEYANRISRYTVPPTFRPPAPSSQAPGLTSSQHPTSVGVPTVNGVSADQVPVHSSTESPRNFPLPGEGIGIASLEQSEVQWLDPLTQLPFVPWPSEEVIRQGALAQVQVMLEQGLDPSNVGNSDVKNIKEEASEDAIMAGSTVKTSTGTNSYAKQPLANGIPKSQEEVKPKVFGGLDLYDPEAEG